MGLTTERAASLLSSMPQAAKEIAGHIHDATGVPFGHELTCSVATSVGDTDLKTMLRRFYVANGGHRGAAGYDPTATELRALYSGERTAASLMRQNKAEPATAPAPAGSITPEEWTERTQKAETAPAAKPAKPAADDAAGKLAELLAQMMAKPQIDEDAVRAIVDEHAGNKVQEALEALRPEIEALAKSASRRVEIVIPDMPTVKIERAHKALPDLLKACAAGISPFLVGPAGSGKTTLAKQIAEALNRPFYMSARVSSEYKLQGFIDATGKAVQTDFRKAYENGGVFLFDEADASDADAFVALNAALANTFADFPDRQVERHPDFVAIAAGNTYGRGANRDYVGRQQLDAATLDRFAIFTVDYDEDLERELAGNDDWTTYVQKVRRCVETEKVRAIISPRASIFGAKLLATGMDRPLVEEATIWKGMAEAERNRVVSAVRYA